MSVSTKQPGEKKPLGSDHYKLTMMIVTIPIGELLAAIISCKTGIGDDKMDSRKTLCGRKAKSIPLKVVNLRVLHSLHFGCHLGLFVVFRFAMVAAVRTVGDRVGRWRKGMEGL